MRNTERQTENGSVITPVLFFALKDENMKRRLIEMSGNKRKFPLWVHTESMDQVQKHYKDDNCKSQSEFIEKAIIFYCGFLSAEDNKKYLPNVVVSSMRGIVQDSENRIARILYKMALEQAITMNVLAAKEDVDDLTLSRIRARCADEIKKSNGAIRFDQAVKYQKGV